MVSINCSAPPIARRTLRPALSWAVERGEAHGWHTLVDGVTLAIYSLPLRQGLLGYAQQTTVRFPAIRLTLAQTNRSASTAILAQLANGFPAAVELCLPRASLVEA